MPTTDELYQTISDCDRRQTAIHRERRNLGEEEAAIVTKRAEARAELRRQELSRAVQEALATPEPAAEPAADADAAALPVLDVTLPGDDYE